MTASVHPIHQPVADSLRQALNIAVLSQQMPDPLRKTFANIERVIRDALEQLGEPNEAMIQAMDKTLDYHHHIMKVEETPGDYHAYLRDSCSIVLRAQVTGWTP